MTGRLDSMGFGRTRETFARLEHSYIRMAGTAVVGLLLAIGPVFAQATDGQQRPPPSSAPESRSEAPWPPEGVYRPGQGVTLPHLVKAAGPPYTGDAMGERIKGSVLLEAIVLADGTVGEVRIKRSLDRRFGVDDHAVKTLKQWQFSAGKKDGVAVPVLMQFKMNYPLAQAPTGGAQRRPSKPTSTPPDPAEGGQPWPPPGVFRRGGDVTDPKAIDSSHASYTPEAMKAKVQGPVFLEAIVLTDGTVGEVRVVGSLDKEHGLDDAAVKAVKTWRFTPGKKGDIAVPVVVEVEMSFWLRK